MKLRLTRGVLIGNLWHEANTFVEVEGRHAEQLVRSGAAYPAPVLVEVEAAISPQRNAERMVSPRQKLAVT